MGHRHEVNLTQGSGTSDSSSAAGVNKGLLGQVGESGQDAKGVGANGRIPYSRAANGHSGRRFAGRNTNRGRSLPDGGPRLGADAGDPLGVPVSTGDGGGGSGVRVETGAGRVSVTLAQPEIVTDTDTGVMANDSSLYTTDSGGRVQQDRLEKSSAEISQEKIASLRSSLEAARPRIRELLGISDGEPDNFFLGVFGSTARNEAQDDSDADAYFFYIRGENTPAFRDAPYLDYDLSQSFDSPAGSMLGYPAGRQPPNPNGKEDVEVHDITGLAEQVASSDPLKTGIVKNSLSEIAIVFSPVYIGDSTYIEGLRTQLIEAMQERAGKPFDQPRFQRLRESGYGPLQFKSVDYCPPFEEDQADGDTTWRLVQEEYERLFGAPLEIRLTEDSSPNDAKTSHGGDTAIANRDTSTQPGVEGEVSIARSLEEIQTSIEEAIKNAPVLDETDDGKDTIQFIREREEERARFADLSDDSVLPYDPPLSNAVYASSDFYPDLLRMSVAARRVGRTDDLVSSDLTPKLAEYVKLASAHEFNHGKRILEINTHAEVRYGVRFYRIRSSGLLQVQPLTLINNITKSEYLESLAAPDDPSPGDTFKLSGNT